MKSLKKLANKTIISAVRKELTANANSTTCIVAISLKHLKT